MWGTWWAWGDARLMSVLVLFLFYLGYMALRASIDDEAKAARAAAVLGLVGLINLPIVKFSVDWWNTLHQPASLMRADGSSHGAGLPVFPADHDGGLWVFFLAVWITAIRTEIVRRRVVCPCAPASRSGGLRCSTSTWAPTPPSSGPPGGSAPSCWPPSPFAPCRRPALERGAETVRQRRGRPQVAQALGRKALKQRKAR
jgi:hypothetical protein